jgi:hypothetical protein
VQPPVEPVVHSPRLCPLARTTWIDAPPTPAAVCASSAQTSITAGHACPVGGASAFAISCRSVSTSRADVAAAARDPISSSSLRTAASLTVIS